MFSTHEPVFENHQDENRRSFLKRCRTWVTLSLGGLLLTAGGCHPRLPRPPIPRRPVTAEQVWWRVESGQLVAQIPPQLTVRNTIILADGKKGNVLAVDREKQLLTVQVDRSPQIFPFESS